MDELIPKILQAICSALIWDWAEFWKIDEKLNALKCSEIWHAPSVRYPNFEEATWNISFPYGIGLPGGVWKSHEPEWMTNVMTNGNFLRAKEAGIDGLHGVFAFPIFVKMKLEGVMTFFNREVIEEDDNLLLMFAEIGNQIGWFIERKQAEAKLQKREHDLG